MKAVVSFLLWCALLVALGLVSWALTLYLAWPYWGGLAIFFGVIGLYFGYKLARRLWVVSRSRVRLAASEAAGRAASQKATHFAELTGKWKEAIDTLRHSSLRRFGNPIYALPWFMVVGEPGVGKTSTVTRSRLSSLNKRVNQLDPIVQTLNCDWWFFNRAVIIDTAGRYVSHAGTEEDVAEWERMLELLAKYRMKEGLNGLVVAIDAAQLISGDHDALERQGQVLRERVDQLIRLFDKRFPIFVMVTKCDQVYGFETWANTLPPEALNQAMGYVGPMEQGDGAEARFLGTALDQIIRRLKRLRLDMAVKGVDLDPALLLFPSELERLRSGLQRFLSASMGNNPYLEQPLLRGLFLSSARQAGEPLAPALVHITPKQPAAAPTEKGVFLHDFFERVLPADRWAFRPTVIVNRWRQATRDLAAVFWLTIFAAALIFVLVSYTQTRNSLREIERHYPTSRLVDNQTREERLRSLYDTLRLIDLILDHEEDWRTRWLAFSPDITRLEEDIKQDYVRGYQAFLDQQDYTRLLSGMPDERESSPLYADTVLAMVRNVNMSQARIDGADYRALLAMPQLPAQVIRAQSPDLPPDITASANRMVVAYKAWSHRDDPILHANLARDRAALQRVVDQSSHLEWLLPWANSQPQLKPVALRDFWRPGSQGKDEGMIEPALTRQGQQTIRAFLQELGQAFEQSSEFQIKRGAFEAWYLAERFNTWQSFAWTFNQGERLLPNEAAWRAMITRLNTPNSPYYLFFDRLKQEFADVRQEHLPDWLRFARDFSALWRVAGSGHSAGKAGALLDTINTVGERVIRQAVDNHELTAAATVQGTVQGVQTYGNYMRDLDAAAAEALGGDGKAYQLAADYFSFSVDPAVKDAKLQTAYDSFQAYRQTSGYEQADDQVLWRLVEGPLALLTRYALEQASCTVQQEWERSVLWKTQMAVSAREINDQLFGDQGSVWAFADGPAKPFLQQRSGGFSVATRHNMSLPFSPGFVPFLNRSVNTRVEAVVKTQLAEAAMGKSANILISARPLGVNPGARAKPYAVNLSIQCAAEELTLDNFNMETTTSFNWSPDQCGDVTLQISIDNLTLTRRYPGPMGMARFVQEFVDGERIFTPDDFPQARDRLEALNVQTLHVRYDFVGQDALLSLANHLDYLADTNTPAAGATPIRLQAQVPERVGQCWTDGIPHQAAAPMPLYIRQRAKQIIETPPEPPAAPPPKPEPAPNRTHRVQDGETLYALARRYGTTVEAIQSLNHLKNSDLILTGHILQIPPETAP